jgi:hypothetical protein
MPEKKFDLGDYIEVKDRIARFYELYGNGRLVTTDVRLTREPDDKPRVLVEAKAYRTPDDPQPGVGWSWMELPGTTSYTKGSELENTETSAWGRAIAALGILTDASIASAQEVRDKQAESPNPRMMTYAPLPPVEGGLIGTVITQGTQDFELRLGPDGYSLPFRVKDGRQSVIVVAHGVLAEALHALKEAVIGERVECFGAMGTDSFVKDGKKINYNVLTLERMVGPDFILPAPGIAVGQEPMFSPAEEADIAAAVDQAPAAGVA